MLSSGQRQGQEHYATLASEHAPKIIAWIREFEEGSSAIMGFGAQLREYLLTHDLAYKEEVHHSQAAVWEDNREGEMVNAARVHQLLLTITNKGWSKDETELALAREISEGNVTKQKNIELVQRSVVVTEGGREGYMLAPVKEDILRIATGVGSHTTCVLRLVAFVQEGGLVPATEGLEQLGVDGWLSYQRIVEKCPTLQGPATRGLTYTIVRKELANLVPDAMRILSEADNSKHDNYQTESAIQTMFNIHRRAVRQEASTAADYATICKQVSRGHKSDFIRAAECFSEYVRNYAGGKEKTLLLELDEYVKSLTVVRDVPPDFFREIAKIKGPHIPLYINALVKATYSCPLQYCKTGKARVFIPSDLSSVLASNKTKVLRANDIMVAARDLGERAKVNKSGVWVGIVGALDVRLVSFIHDKSTGRKAFASLAHIACAFYDELCARFKDQVAQFPCPWVAVPLAGSATSDGSKDTMSIRELNTRGAVCKTTLIEFGFVVGALVRPKSEKKSSSADEVEPQAIVAIGDGIVELADETKLTFKDAVADWVASASEKIVMMHVPTHTTVENMMELARSTCKVALHAAYDVHAGDLDKIHIEIAPRRGVFCLEKLMPKALKLVPKTYAVIVVCEGTEPSNSVLIGIGGLKHPTKGPTLIGCASAPKMHVPSAANYAADPDNEKYDIIPYWLVATTPDSASANLEIASMTMSISTKLKGTSIDSKTTTISIPILTNTKIVHPGTELLVFKAAKRTQGDFEMQPPKVQKKEKGKGHGKGKAKK